jgi:hypothetical protein
LLEAKCPRTWDVLDSTLPGTPAISLVSGDLSPINRNPLTGTVLDAMATPDTGVGDGVAVGVLVGVRVGVLVLVAVKVGVRVGVLVAVGVAVGGGRRMARL